MNDEDSTLDEATLRALRDVPPVDPQVRERHIAAALGAVVVPASGARTIRATARQWSVAAAAALVLGGVGFALGSATSNPDNGLTGMADTSVTVDSVPVKGNAPTTTEGTTAEGTSSGAAQAMAREAESPCDDTIGSTPIARYRADQGWRLVYIRDAPAPVLLTVDEGSCTIVAEIGLP